MRPIAPPSLPNYKYNPPTIITIPPRVSARLVHDAPFAQASVYPLTVNIAPPIVNITPRRFFNFSSIYRFLNML